MKKYIKTIVAAALLMAFAAGTVGCKKSSSSTPDQSSFFPRVGM